MNETRKATGVVSIYKVTNISNGIMYIGQTVQPLRRRWVRHLYDALVKSKPQPFYDAIREFGRDSFVIEKIDETIGQTAGDDLETHYIAKYDATNPAIGYNRMSGGRSGRHSPENKIKIGEKSREWWGSLENKQRASESRKGLLVGDRNPMFGRHDLGKPHTEETRQYLSDKRKEMFKDPEFKARMSEANTGKHHTEEGKAHIAQALKGNQYRKGIPHDPETKARIADSMRRAWDKKRVQKMDSPVSQIDSPEATVA